MLFHLLLLFFSLFLEFFLILRLLFLLFEFKVLDSFPLLLLLFDNLFVSFTDLFFIRLELLRS